MNIHNDYAWGTHKPVLSTILEYFGSKLDVIVESGVGIHSTPLLNCIEKYVGIENDAQWFENLIKGIEIGQLIHFPVKFRAGESVNRVSKAELKRIENWYNELEIPEGKLKLLFVDGFSATRAACINSLKDKVDIIVFHDAQIVSDFWYGYTKVKWPEGSLNYLTSPKAWTGFFTKAGLEINWTTFIQILTKHKEAFMLKNKDCTFMEIL
jgi:hypothetical protein